LTGTCTRSKRSTHNCGQSAEDRGTRAACCLSLVASDDTGSRMLRCQAKDGTTIVRIGGCDVPFGKVRLPLYSLPTPPGGSNAGAGDDVSEPAIPFVTSAGAGAELKEALRKALFRVAQADEWSHVRAGVTLQDIVPVGDASAYENLLRYEYEARALGYPELRQGELVCRRARKDSTASTVNHQILKVGSAMEPPRRAEGAGRHRPWAGVANRACSYSTSPPPLWTSRCRPRS
jgi:hypothetical protein